MKQAYSLLTYSAIVIILLLTSCQTTPRTVYMPITPEPFRDTTPMPTIEYKMSSFDFTTKDPDGLRPLLFQPEDLSDTWLPQTYIEQTEELLPPRTNNPFEDRMEISVAAERIPPPNFMGYTPGTKHRASQLVWRYQDEVTAIAAFVSADYFYGSVPPSVTFHPRIQNFAIGCLDWTDGQRCYFTAQYGRYITHAIVFIDGRLITLDDWEELVHIVQDRLIQYGAP
jgi:hypothetical protein